MILSRARCVLSVDDCYTIEINDIEATIPIYSYIVK